MVVDPEVFLQVASSRETSWEERGGAPAVALELMKTGMSLPQACKAANREMSARKAGDYYPHDYLARKEFTIRPLKPGVEICFRDIMTRCIPASGYCVHCGAGLPPEFRLKLCRSCRQVAQVVSERRLWELGFPCKLGRVYRGILYTAIIQSGEPPLLVEGSSPLHHIKEIKWDALRTCGDGSIIVQTHFGMFSADDAWAHSLGELERITAKMGDYPFPCLACRHVSNGRDKVCYHCWLRGESISPRSPILRGIDPAEKRVVEYPHGSLVYYDEGWHLIPKITSAGAEAKELI